VLIALFVRDTLVRPYLGDTLAVALVYCGLRAVLPLRPGPAAVLAFAVAAAIEFGQYVDVLDMLGLRSNPIARVVLGTGFDPRDFIAYLAGALLAFGVEHLRARRPAAPAM
jgi:hypothetical protein